MKKILLSLILLINLPIFASDGLNYDVKYRVHKIGNEQVSYNSKVDKINKIGLQTVAYDSSGRIIGYGYNQIVYGNDGRILKIGDKKVTYCDNGFIDKVGNLDIVYSYRRMSKIGNADVQYNVYGEIEKIKNLDDCIKNSNGDLDIQYSYYIANNNCSIPLEIKPSQNHISKNVISYTIPYSKMLNPTSVNEKDPDPEIEIILGAFDSFIRRGDHRAAFFTDNEHPSENWVYSIGNLKVYHKMTGLRNVIRVGKNNIARDENNKVVSIGDIKITRNSNGIVTKIGNDTVHRYQNGIISAVGRKKYFRNQDGTVFAIGDYDYTTDHKGYLKTISNMEAYVDIFPGKIIYLKESDSYYSIVLDR